MKPAYYVSLAAAALCLVLSVVIFVVGSLNQGGQTEVQQQQQQFQAQQEQINAGNAISQQVGPNLLRDMAISSIKNDKMKGVLTKHGYNVNYTPPGDTAPNATPPPTLRLGP